MTGDLYLQVGEDQLLIVRAVRGSSKWMQKAESSGTGLSGNGTRLLEVAVKRPSAIYSAASSVQETSDGGYILAGVIGPVNSSGKEAWLIKTDKNGNGQWNKTFGGKGNDGASSVQQTADGGYILAGSPTDEGAQDAWLIKTDTNGNEQWNLTFGGKFNAYSVAQTADGGYIMAGDTFPPGADDRVVWLIKVSGDNRNNETKMSPVEKAGGFEAALAITILLTLYKTGKRRIK